MYYNTYGCYNFPSMPRKFVYLIGNPVEHSISPQMHNAAYKKLRLEFEYLARQVKEEDLKKAVESLRLSDVAGANVTVPYKEKVVRFLDGIDEEARLIGAVNTVVNKGGKLLGSNTDMTGFLDSLKHDAGVVPDGKMALVLGAGGGARAVCAGLCKSACGAVFIHDIETQKAQKLAKELSGTSMTSVSAVTSSTELEELFFKVDIIINCTPVGMFPQEEACPAPEGAVFSPRQTVYDLVYNPSQTLLVKKARAKGAAAVTGLGMLVRQGAASFKLFTGLEAPVDVMMKAAQKALLQK